MRSSHSFSVTATKLAMVQMLSSKLRDETSQTNELLSFYIKAINVNVPDLRLIEYLAQFTHFKSTDGHLTSSHLVTFTGSLAQ